MPRRSRECKGEDLLQVHQVVVVVRVVLLLLPSMLWSGTAPTVMPDCSLFWDSVSASLRSRSTMKNTSPSPHPPARLPARGGWAPRSGWRQRTLPRPGLGEPPCGVAFPAPAGRPGASSGSTSPRSPRRRGGPSCPSGYAAAPAVAGHVRVRVGANRTAQASSLAESFRVAGSPPRFRRRQRRGARAVGRAPLISSSWQRPAPPRSPGPVELERASQGRYSPPQTLAFLPPGP